MTTKHFNDYLHHSGSIIPSTHYDNTLIKQIRKKIKDSHIKQSELFINQFWHSIRANVGLEKADWVNYIQLVTNQVEDKEATTLVAQELIGMINRASLLLLHAELNKSVPIQKNVIKLQQTLDGAIEEKESILAQAKVSHKELEEELDQWLLFFYQLDLTADFEQALFYSNASAFSQWCDQELKQLASTSNFLTDFGVALQQDRKRSFSEKIGEINAKNGTLSRQILAAQAGIWQLYLQKSLYLKPDFTAQKLPFIGGKFEDGKNIPIHKIAQQTEDDFVETKGFVSEIEAFRASDKELVCRAKIVDPSSNKSVWIAVPFVHLRHLGIEVGAYVIVHGTVQHESPLNQKKLAIHIDKLAFSELKDESWRTALLHSAKDYYQAWYSGLNMEWSLSKHLQNNKEKEVLKMGAGELIFQPLFRGAAFQDYRANKY